MSFTISNLTNTELERAESKIIETMRSITAYTPLLIIAFGITGNPATLFFIVSSKSLRKMSSMVILVFISIVETLFNWNLNHFFEYKFSYRYEIYNIYSCRIMTFVQYFSLQSSGFLLSLLTIDRYFTITSTPGSFYSKLPFRTTKSAIIWSFLILGIIFILNSHILFLDGYFDPPSYFNKTIEIKINESAHFLNKKSLVISNDVHCGKYSTGFNLLPLWDQVNIFLYSFIPAILMLTFNSLLVYKITTCDSSSRTKRNDKELRKHHRKKRNLTLSFLSVSTFFLISSLPVETFYAYFFDFFSLALSNLIGSFLDFFSFLNHSTLFYNLILFNVKFRKNVIFKLKKLFGLQRCIYDE